MIIYCMKRGEFVFISRNPIYFLTCIVVLGYYGFVFKWTSANNQDR